MVTICTASVTLNNSTFCPHSVFMCFVWISEQTAIISLYSINWVVFTTQMVCVYCAVRSGSKRRSGNAWPLKDPKFRQNVRPVSLLSTETEVFQKLLPRRTVANCQIVAPGAPITASHLHTSSPAALPVGLTKLRRQSPTGTLPDCTNCRNQIFTTDHQAYCLIYFTHKMFGNRWGRNVRGRRNKSRGVINSIISPSLYKICPLTPPPPDIR